VQTEHKAYYEALSQHPRALVGRQVPSITGEGQETLRNSDDAREWQDAVKHLLVAEVNDRASQQMDESKDFLATVHQSIELFQNNPDLIPGAKTFDRELADRFATLVQPYELRVEGKLQGYSIPVQQLVNQVRTQLTAERAKNPAPSTPAPAAPAAPSPGTGAGGAAPAADPPQAGIQSKAGHGESSEDFSTLFGTIGLPNLQI